MDTTKTLELMILQSKDVASKIDDIELLNRFAREVAGPFNKKISDIKKAQREVERQEREGNAQRLCEALKPGEAVLMCEHGFLNIFDPGNGRDRFYSADATVYAYQPRKKILWLNVTGTAGREKFKDVRAFTLADVARWQVRRKVA